MSEVKIARFVDINARRSIFSEKSTFVLCSSYCQMLWMRFFSVQPRSRSAGCFPLFIPPWGPWDSPASKARFIKALACKPVTDLASVGG
jgi:hypothetical protein